jgi:hypothetical protein
LPHLPTQLRNLGLKLLNPVGLPHHQSNELLIRQTAISRHPTIVNKMAARSTSHAGDLTSHLMTTAKPDKGEPDET